MILCNARIMIDQIEVYWGYAVRNPAEAGWTSSMNVECWIHKTISNYPKINETEIEIVREVDSIRCMSITEYLCDI